MPFAIAFDIDTAAYKSAGATDSQVTQLYQSAQNALTTAGFNRIQHSVYATEQEDLGCVVLAINALRAIPEFQAHCSALHAFEMRAWSDMLRTLR